MNVVNNDDDLGNSRDFFNFFFSSSSSLFLLLLYSSYCSHSNYWWPLKSFHLTLSIFISVPSSNDSFAGLFQFDSVRTILAVFDSQRKHTHTHKTLIHSELTKQFFDSNEKKKTKIKTKEKVFSFEKVSSLGVMNDDVF